MIERRHILKAALGAVAVSMAPQPARGRNTPPSSPFSRDTVIDLARALATKPYSAPASDSLASLFQILAMSNSSALSRKQAPPFWAGRNKGFSSSSFTAAISSQQQLTCFSSTMERRRGWITTRELSDYGALKLPEKLPGSEDFQAFASCIRRRTAATLS
jgi:glucans biosynthesis protein